MQPINLGKIGVVLRRTNESAVLLERAFHSIGLEKDLLEVRAVSLLLLLFGLL